MRNRRPEHAAPGPPLAINGVLRLSTTLPPSEPEVMLEGHRQVKLEGDGKASKLARVANLCGGLGASDLGPDREGLCADGSVLGGRKVIAAERKEVVDLIVGGEEPLRLAG